MNPPPAIDLALPPAPGTFGALPLVEELPASLDPWESARRLCVLPWLLFLDSSDRDSPWGQHSFVTADPFATMLAGVGDPFPELTRRLAEFQAEPLPGLPPFQGGAAGLWGYDLNRRLETLPAARIDEFGLPPMAIGLYDWVLAFDHVRRRNWIISTGFPMTDPASRRQRAAGRIREVKTWLGRVPAAPPPLAGPRREVEQLCPQFPLPGRRGVTSNFDRPAYLQAVARAVEYVHAGDCFQVNLAQRLLTPLREPPLELYARLRSCNPSPFGGCFAPGNTFAVISASPERFLRVQAGEAMTLPIKGTRPRGSTPAEDAQRQAQLLASEKDRAENAMIVDLMRNDLGRVCRYGSVRVEALCRLESFRHVHHLVSEVRGRLRPGAGPLDLLRAAFPGGSVTGAPKIRAMEIIAELEPTARGPYCGSLGYIGFDGSMDTNILIRTFTVSQGWAQFPVGGGIVADSIPELEYEETLHKAEGLLRALR